MVSARLVDFPESPEDEEIGPIPEMMFAAGEEPIGVRVLTYQSSSALQRIFNALGEDEVAVIKQSSFGKLIEIAEKPVFSGRFARYLLSRQLKTNKKYETWFRFAGKPVRFSLREFAIVTGLPCGPFPRRSKMKLKKTIVEKPYWPSLFGKVDVVTVTEVIKMLYRQTFKDREIRIKYACLALLEAVLLPTSLNMKIAREHAEAIEDLEEFFSYPWGRVAFQLLIGSIKERDEISLSQNTISLKGFVLALQLVFVEAVPALTDGLEVICSDSDSESEDNEVIGRDIFSKKHTLNPAHARNVDKTCEADVTSLLDVDPTCPIEELNCVWPDEVEDYRVDNLVRRLLMNWEFKPSSFFGGVTKIDVDRMRAAAKSTRKGRKVSSSKVKSGLNETSCVAASVVEMIRPRLELMDEKIQVACSRVEAIDVRVGLEVDSKFLKMKEEMLNSVKDMVYSMCKNVLHGHNGPSQSAPPTSNAVSVHSLHRTPEEDVNARNIENVLRNLSEYTTPPRSTHMMQENVIQSKHADVGSGFVTVTPMLQTCALSENSDIRSRQNSFRERVEGFKKQGPNLNEEPSFSLGLTQEEHEQPQPNMVATQEATISPTLRLTSANGDSSLGGEIPNEENSAHSATRGIRKRTNSLNRICLEGNNRLPETVHAEPSITMGLTQEGMRDVAGIKEGTYIPLFPRTVDMNVDDNLGELEVARKSKRPRSVPSALVEDYQCGRDIMSRVRESQKYFFLLESLSVCQRKYALISTKMIEKFVLNVDGLYVSEKDIRFIIERSRFFTAKVIDILVRVVRAAHHHHLPIEGQHSVHFMDSKFLAAINRTYPKFLKSRSKESFRFPNFLRDMFPDADADVVEPKRYYFPCNVESKHWLGICFDSGAGVITLLDCNVSMFKQSSLEQNIKALVQMLPYLARFACQPVGEDPVLHCFDVVRPKSVSQISNPSDSGLMAVLFMARHAVYGIEGCKGITSEVLEQEGRGAAIVAYEFKEEL